MFRPSIVVTDLVMPRMSGIELLKALQPEIDHIKVILLTAQGTVDTAVEAVKSGAEDYLTKPLDPQQAAAPARTARGAQSAEAREPGAAAPAERSRPLRPHHRQQPRDARVVSGARTGRADAGVDADPRRVGHRQGAGRANDSSAQPARARAVRRRSTAPRFPTRCSRAKSSGMRRARSPAPPIGAPGVSSSPIAARCFSTRLPR